MRKRQHRSKFEYEDERNADLMHCYHTLLRCDGVIRTDDIFRRLVCMPSRRFWVSEERAKCVILAMLKGNVPGCMSRNKRRMYTDLLDRYKRLREMHREWSSDKLVFHAVREPAPCFYLTPATAKIYVYKIKREWKERNWSRVYRSL